MDFEMVASPAAERRAKAAAVAAALHIEACLPKEGAAITFTCTGNTMTFYSAPTAYIAVDISTTPSAVAFRLPPRSLAMATARLTPFTAYGQRLFDGKRTSVSHYKGARYTYNYGPVYGGHKVIAHEFRLLLVEPLLLLKP